VNSVIESQVILITGGPGGIGQALALSLAASGNRIAITGRSPSQPEATRKLLPENSLAIERRASERPLPGRGRPLFL